MCELGGGDIGIFRHEDMRDMANTRAQLGEPECVCERERVGEREE